MKAMLGAFVAIALIAVIASYGLSHAGFSSARSTSGTDVRLSSE